jgi:uncharacterized membrane protein
MITKPKPSKDQLYSMSNNPSNWRGLIYVNSRDPRMIVPKRLPSLGWTLNFGHPISYVFMCLFVGAVIAAVFLSK